MTFHIPESLKVYYGDVAVRRAVDALSANLDGTHIPEARWEEARNYNQALLMAAQVRADLVDLLFRVWDESFGRAEPDRLGEDYPGFEDGEDGDSSLADLWNGKELERCYYRDNLPPSEDGRSDVLGVWMPEKRSLGLYVVRYAVTQWVTKLPLPERLTGQKDGRSRPTLRMATTTLSTSRSM